MIIAYYLALCVICLLAILLAVYGDIRTGYRRQVDEPPVWLPRDLDRLEHKPHGVWLVHRFDDGCELWTCLKRYQ